MTARIGINGFGRMGRLALRASWDWPDFDVVHINELRGGPAAAAHLLEFDSVHGRWDRPIASDDEAIIIGGKRVTYSNHPTPEQIPWDDLGVDVVVEATGAFRTPESLQPHFERGAKKVVVAAPVKEGALNVVVGCNDHLYDAAVHHLITAASCTTNCLAPVVKVIHENIGIERGVITTLHDVTNTQVVIDAMHKDLRRARSCLTSLIPTTTGSAKAITMIYPELAGKLNGVAVRVPLLNASLTDCVFQVKRATSESEVNQFLQAASEGALRGILGFESRPLVSVDFVNDTRSGIVDGPSTMVIDDRLVKILAWYDNEIGYVHRMMELVQTICQIGWSGQ